MEKTSTSGTSSAKKRRKKATTQQSTPQNATKRAGRHEATIPLMMRPRISQKECVEQIAEQIGVKRSQLDPTFYMTGAILMGLERLGKTEQIGTWSRKEAAVYLKSAFTPLFELLYEQGELPLVFSLLLSHGNTFSSTQSLLPELEQEPGQALKTRKLPPVTDGSEPVAEEDETTEADLYVPLLSADAEIGLDGFPGGI
jgi:hypothetical protein